MALKRSGVRASSAPPVVFQRILSVSDIRVSLFIYCNLSGGVYPSNSVLPDGFSFGFCPLVCSNREGYE